MLSANRAKIKALYDVYDTGTVKEFTATYVSTCWQMIFMLGMVDISV